MAPHNIDTRMILTACISELRQPTAEEFAVVVDDPALPEILREVTEPLLLVKMQERAREGKAPASFSVMIRLLRTMADMIERCAAACGE